MFIIRLKFSNMVSIHGSIIRLPMTDAGEIDFAFMDTLIHAVEKLVIKDVVLYTDKKIAAAKQVTAE